MEIEMKDLLGLTDKGVLVEPAESALPEIIKGLVKNELKEETKEKYQETCRLLAVILQNIAKNPDEDKFRIIKVSNPKFQSNVGQFPTAMMILEVIGFESVEDTEKILIFHQKECSHLQEISDIISKAQVKQEKVVVSEIKKAPVYVRPKKNNEKGVDLSDQLQEYRAMQRTRPASQKNDRGYYQSNAHDHLQNHTHSYSPPSLPAAVPVDLRSMMIKVFELTNYFRVNQGKQVLIWKEELSIIAWEHSRDMGEGKVKVGHDGYNKRYKRFSFKKTKGGAENVAYNSGYHDPAQICMDAWIGSASHRKNLIGKFNHVGVGVFMNASGIFFFTQLFALV